MNKISTIGRILFALPFIIFGVNHFIMADYYMGMITSFIPLGAYTIIMTGIILIGLGISILTKLYIKQAAFMLAGLLLLFIITIHIPHLIKGNETTITLIALLKDISLMGGSLMIAGLCGDDKKQKT